MISDKVNAGTVKNIKNKTVYAEMTSSFPPPKVKERLFRIGLKHDPYCIKCAGAEVSDIVHYFCTCEAVCNTWSWLKRQVVQLGHMGAGVDNWELVNLLFPKSRCDPEIVWLVSSYVLYVWETVHVKNSEVKFDRFFGYLTFKYKMHQATSCEQLTKELI